MGQLAAASSAAAGLDALKLSSHKTRRLGRAHNVAVVTRQHLFNVPALEFADQTFLRCEEGKALGQNALCDGGSEGVALSPFPSLRCAVATRTSGRMPLRRWRRRSSSIRATARR
jgi:hypothetical protein